jgi:hypothetical protein
MKKISFLIVALLFSTICFSQDEPENSKKTRIDIYYFHRTVRCETCTSIEENTQKTLDQYFSDELEDGSIKLYSIDYEENTEKELIEKYDVSGPALYLTKVKKGKETSKDLTDFAFDNSLYRSRTFKEGLRDEINALFR